MTEGLYVYCVIGTGEARNFGPVGMGGRGDVVTTIAYRDLSAVVSSVPMDRYEVGRDALLANEQVLERVMTDHAVLPVRFYTVAPNAEEIRSLLRGRYHEFEKLLREMDDKVELGLKALWKDLDSVLRGAVQAARDTAMEAKERRRTTEAAGSSDYRSALEAHRARMQEWLLAPLMSSAIDLRLHRTYGDDMIVNAAFLVDRSREMEFDARVDQLSAAYGDSIQLKYVGPAPPFSFVNIVINREAVPTGFMHREETR